MERPFDVMVAGHVCLDVIPEFHETGASEIGEILRPGKLVNMGPARLSTGGAVSNTGIAMKRLGTRVSFSARVGDDEFGRVTLEILRRNGDPAGIHVVSGSSSSYTVVLAPPNIDRIFLHHPGANNEYGADDLEPSLIAQCRLFHFGYPPLMRRMFDDGGRELERVFRMAKEAGATTSCDLASPDPASEAGKAPWLEILERILPHVDIFLPSAEEALYVLERDRFLEMKYQHGGQPLLGILTSDDYTRLADKILSMGARMTSLKSGHLGFYLKTGQRDVLENMGAGRPADLDNWANRELWCPAFTVEKVASATGSGDSSIAGFLTAILRERRVEDAMRIAACLGWQNVQVLDATSGIRSWDETLRQLDSLKQVNEVDVLTDGWAWHGAHGVWAGPEDLLNAG